MKKGWQTKTLGEVCAFDKAQGIHRGLPYVGLEHIESHTARFIGSSEPQPVKSSTFRFSDKHVLYGRLRPYLNKALAPDFDGHCSTEIFPLKPRPELSREYLLFWLLADETCDRINATCTGARMPRAQMNDVLSFEIPVPPLAEQQRIVGLLDEAFEGLATAKSNAEKNLQNARALFESHLQSVFAQRGPGWVEKKLSALYKIGSSKRVLKSEWKTEGVPFYRGREVTRLAADGFVDNELFISEEHFADLSKEYGVPEAGDIVITAIGTIGNAHVVRRSDRFYFKDASVLWMKRTADVSSEFIRFWLKSSLFLDQLDRGNGATVDTLTIQKLQSVELRLPQLVEQKKIITELNALTQETQRLARLYEKKLAALESLKKSLLHQAFTGELL